jgi:hypothetical protein
MSTERHPITPSRELAQQWTDQIYGGPGAVVGSDDLCLAKLAAQWGADTELEACCEWADETGWQGAGDGLRTARRSKPPSLRRQALAEIDALENMGACNSNTIRRALEALPND